MKTTHQQGPNDGRMRRKVRVAMLNARIVLVRWMMDQEQGVSDNWKRLAREYSRLINERNQMRTLDDIRRIERRRGL